MTQFEEYIEENLALAEQVFNDNKDYSKEENLLDRIQSFNLYRYARNWIRSYNKFHLSNK